MDHGSGRLVLLAFALATAGNAAAFDVQGHRGARGLAPENTLAAFRKAIDLGVTTLETDAAVTRDDVVVISHDPHLDPAIVRDPDGRWLRERGPAIRALTFAELARFDIGRLDPSSRYAQNFPLQRASDGERFAMLDDVLALAKQAGVRVNVETKITPTSGDTTPDAETFARLVVERIRAAGMSDRATIQSFDWRTLMVVKRIAPEIATSCLTSQNERSGNVRADASGRSPWLGGLALADHGGSLSRLAKAAGCAIWSPAALDVTRELIAEAHAIGITVVPWTVNDSADMVRLIDWGADGLISDYPDRVRDAVSAATARGGRASRRRRPGVRYCRPRRHRRRR
jgi:glycerophosphoryl diester phosphodiesterase